MNDDAGKIYDLLQKFHTAMLVTHVVSGDVRARPMAIADTEKNGAIWFITDRESAKVHEIENDTRVLVVAQRDRDVYLSIVGAASLVIDRAQVDRIWNDKFTVWFPDGKNDPEIALIRVESLEAEYWDNSGTKKIQYLIQVASAYFSGKRPTIKEGEQHGTVELQS